ncbi:unnamed protein product [Protopolystoma xenopodis]|uniref:Uncharacterized protein n=1 Tax=Protopolystoma xenopodis TaxID=117903 RepID=A0A3S5AQ85_9PLAT|nr:unnamed protein product [Protopolystoma xenopodis]
MSPDIVSLQVGLMKRNDLHYRYQMVFVGLLAYILPPFFLPACSQWRLSLTMPGKRLEMYPTNGPTLEITNTIAEDTRLGKLNKVSLTFSLSCESKVEPNETVTKQKATPYWLHIYEE